MLYMIFYMVSYQLIYVANPTELVHDKFMRHVLLIMLLSSHVLPFSAPSLSTFWRHYSTSCGKLVLKTTRTNLHWLPLLKCHILEGKRYFKKSEVWEM